MRVEIVTGDLAGQVGTLLQQDGDENGMVVVDGQTEAIAIPLGALSALGDTSYFSDQPATFDEADDRLSSIYPAATFRTPEGEEAGFYSTNTARQFLIAVGFDQAASIELVSAGTEGHYINAAVLQQVVVALTGGGS